LPETTFNFSKITLINTWIRFEGAQKAAIISRIGRLRSRKSKSQCLVNHCFLFLFTYPSRYLTYITSGPSCEGAPEQPSLPIPPPTSPLPPSGYPAHNYQQHAGFTHHDPAVAAANDPEPQPHLYYRPCRKYLLGSLIHGSNNGSFVIMVLLSKNFIQIFLFYYRSHIIYT
jgi:hypothetical protein